MAYSRRRPTGGYGGSIFEKPSKAVFEAVSEQYGKVFVVTRENVGAWNECRVWTCAGEVVETAVKGNAPDWAYMIQWCVK